jgi:hypothetical protein
VDTRRTAEYFEQEAKALTDLGLARADVLKQQNYVINEVKTTTQKEFKGDFSAIPVGLRLPQKI